MSRDTRNAMVFAELATLGFERTSSPTSKSYEFKGPIGFVYLVNSDQTKLVLDPSRVRSGATLAGVLGKISKSSSFREFPKLSPDEECFGIGFALNAVTDVKRLMIEYGAL